MGETRYAYRILIGNYWKGIAFKPEEMGPWDSKEH